MGLPDQARARVKALEDAGIERVMLQTFLPFDLDQIRLLGEIFLGWQPQRSRPTRPAGQ